jgi:hypothetical protein
MIRHSQSAVPAVSIRALIRPWSTAPTGSSSGACHGEHNLARQPQHRISVAAWAARLEAIYEEARDGQPEEARG